MCDIIVVTEEDIKEAFTDYFNSWLKRSDEYYEINSGADSEKYGVIAGSEFFNILKQVVTK